MANKLISDIDYFEGYQLLGIVSHLKDYSLAFFLNQNLEIDLKKYKDMTFVDGEGKKFDFSWYFYKNEHIQSKIYLISNSSSAGKLFPSKKEMDYFLLFKDYPNEENYINEVLPEIRKIQNILAVFEFDLNDIKNAELFLENNELHEIKNTLRPKSKFKKPLSDIKD